jgi:sphingomyelin phosphodiesterase acid-like 3
VPDTSSDPDPFGQFAWLDATLAALQAQDKLAYITGHIAPIVDSYGGNPQWHVHYIDRYKTVVGKYPGVVKAQFFGHVHSIEFRVPVPGLEAPGGYNNNAGEEDPEQLIPLFVTGSISPLFGNNPSFIVWDFDAETYDVLDFTVYGSDIADSAPQLAWRQLFKATT